MLKTKREIIAFVTDKHSGSKLGLCNPETELKDEHGEVIHLELNEPQKYLWDLNVNKIDDIVHFANNDPMYLFDLGDQSQGNKHPDELMGSRISDQFFIAEASFLPWLKYKNLKSIRMAEGTAAHVFGEGSSEITVEGLLQRRRTGKDIRIVRHGLSTINQGAVVDYAHHGPNTGSRNWLNGNEARYYLRSMMQDEIDCGHIPPDIVARGHYHSTVVEFLRKRTNGHHYDAWLVVVPSMCMLGEFATMKTKSSYRVTNGMIAFEVINGQTCAPIEFTSTLDIRTQEEI